MGERTSRVAFILLMTAGWLGAHRFYLFRFATGAAQLALSLLCALLWIFGGNWSHYAPYLLGPILFWIVHDAFWLSDYFRVEEEMDTSLQAFHDSDPAPEPKADARKSADKSSTPRASRLQSLVGKASALDDADEQKKARAVKLAKRQIAESLKENHPKAAITAAERLVKYLQQRSRRPQSDPHLAEAYLLQGMVLYHTQYTDAASKKLQMGVHLGSAFAHLSVQVQQAQGWIDNLRNPQAAVEHGSGAVVVQPGQYELLMKTGDWNKAAQLCAQTIALRQSAKSLDVADLALHHLNALDIALKLGQRDDALHHGEAVLNLVQQHPSSSQNAVPARTHIVSLERLGDMAFADSNHDKADQYYRDALALAQAPIAQGANSANGRACSDAQICGLLQRQAINFERAGDFDNALASWRSAAAYIARLGDTPDDSEAVSDVLTRYAAFSVRHQPQQVKPLIEQSLRLQMRSYRGYSSAAARAYEVFAQFMQQIQQPAAHVQYLRQALLVYQVCEPDNLQHLQTLKTAIAQARSGLARPSKGLAMTYEGMLYALSRYDLRSFLIEPFSVDAYLQRSAIRGGPNAKLELGAHWQTLMQALPEINDSVNLEGTPAAQCWVWPADRVGDGIQRLALVDASTFSQRVQAQLATPVLAAQLPSEAVRIEFLRTLLRLKAELKAFLQAAAQRRDATMLYVV